MKKLSKVVSIVLSLALCLGMASPAFAASFTDLQNAIDGKEGTGTAIKNEDGTDTGRYGYSWNEKTEEKDGYWGIEAWDDEETGRNVQLNEDVNRESSDSQIGPVTVSGDKDVTLDLNGSTIYGYGRGSSETSTITVTGKDTSLTLTDSKGGGAISGNQKTPQWAGGVIVDDGASFTMNGGKITEFNGGLAGVEVKNGTFQMEGGEISGNARTGVLVSGENSSFTMEAGIISENKAGQNRAGGVTVTNGACFTMNGGNITGNTSTDRGGGVHLDGATFKMHGGNIIGNTAGNGGGIHGGNKSTIEITADPALETEINISKNTSTGSGGGIFVEGDTGNSLDINGAIMNENQAGGLGGALFIWGTSNHAAITNTTMLDNTSREHGSAIRAHSAVDITNSQIENTKEPDVYTVWVGPNGKVTLTDTTLTNGSVQTAHEGSLHMGEGSVIENGKVSISTEVYEGLGGGSFESNGYTVHIDKEGNVTITDAEGNTVETIVDANGNSLSVGTLKADEDGKIDIQLTFPLHVHTPGETIRENEVAAQIGMEGSYDEVVYCSVCGGEISREQKTTEPLAPPETPDVPGTDIPDPDIPMADGSGTPTTTTIEDQEVPLAGLVSRQILVSYLYAQAGSPDGEDAEGECVKALAWAVANGIIDAESDPEEVVTVAILRDVMTRYAKFLDVIFDAEIPGEDDEIVMNCNEILEKFFAELEKEEA